jgi:hypothetical protein
MDTVKLVLVTIAAVVVVAVVLGFVLAWPAMILFGIVHAFWPFLPAFGFWQTLAVVILARLLVGTFSAQANA